MVTCSDEVLNLQTHLESSVGREVKTSCRTGRSGPLEDKEEESSPPHTHSLSPSPGQTWIKAEVSRFLFDEDATERGLGRIRTGRIWITWIHQLLFESWWSAGVKGLRQVALVEGAGVTARWVVGSAGGIVRERQAGVGQLPLESEGREDV